MVSAPDSVETAGCPVSLKELPLPSIASLRATAALRSPYLALVRPARIGLGFESAGANQKTLAEVEALLGGPGRLSLPYSLCWLLDVLSGLGVLHRTLGFVHGEVQPEHIVLGDDGVGRLIPVVRAHWVRGEQRAPERLYYLAPEKLLGDGVDVRSDVFSVGVMLWEALAGRPLLEAHAVDDIIARLMSGGIGRARAPEAEAWTEPLTAIAERAIAVDPGRRYASVGEMRDALHAACSRYLASPPGMAELFRNPEQRARNFARDSLPPESQRATLPPEQAKPSWAPTLPPPPNSAHESAPQAAAERLPRAGSLAYDLEEETTTTKPTGAPSPAVNKAKHISTLLGVQAPFFDRESSPDDITLPFAKIPPSAPVVITPLPLVRPASVKPMPARTLTPAGPPAQLFESGSVAPAALASAPAPASAPALASAPAPARLQALSPVVAPRPTPSPLVVPEPSFELVRPRKSRGALWLVLGAAFAIGVFAARPWLSEQLAAAIGSLPDNAAASNDVADGDAPPKAASVAAPPSNTANGEAPAPSARLVGIASTPASPTAAGALRVRSRHEEHVVIHDSVEPEVAEPARPAAAEPKVEAPVAPAPAPTVPAAPAATPKPKTPPVSEADRYGI